MARLPRLTVPGHPHHILQRGNNRQPIFSSGADRQLLLNLLAESATRFAVDVHAYVLMDDHFHLLATPRSTGSLPQMMQAVGRRYVRYFNNAQSRSGTLWEGRYRSAVLQADRYLLICMAYMDLNPVRGGLAALAQDFAWSSHGHYAGQRTDKLLSAHPLIWSLGNTPFERESNYRNMVQAGITAQQQNALTQSVVGGWALGDPEFLAVLQKMTNRRLSKGLPGRPARQKEL